MAAVGRIVGSFSVRNTRGSWGSWAGVGANVDQHNDIAAGAGAVDIAAASRKSPRSDPKAAAAAAHKRDAAAVRTAVVAAARSTRAGNCGRSRAAPPGHSLPRARKA